MESLRHRRVRELLKRQVGEALRQEFSVADVGVVTVNDVAVGRDLKSAVVYVSMVGSSEQQQHLVHRLKSERGHIQTIVARSLTMKYTPRLRFIMDDAIERGDRVLKILSELEETEPQE